MQRSPKHLSATFNGTAFLRAFLRDDVEQDLVEYALVAALVGLLAVLSITNLNTEIATTFNTISSQLTATI